MNFGSLHQSRGTFDSDDSTRTRMYMEKLHSFTSIALPMRTRSRHKYDQTMLLKCFGETQISLVIIGQQIIPGNALITNASKPDYIGSQYQLHNQSATTNELRQPELSSEIWIIPRVFSCGSYLFFNEILTRA